MALQDEIGQAGHGPAHPSHTVHIRHDPHAEIQTVLGYEFGFRVQDSCPGIGTGAHAAQMTEVHQVSKFVHADGFPCVPFPVRQPKHLLEHPAGDAHQVPACLAVTALPDLIPKFRLRIQGSGFLI